MSVRTHNHHPVQRWTEDFRVGATCLAQYDYAACKCGLVFVVDYWTRDALWTAEDDVNDSVRHWNLSLAGAPDKLDAVPVAPDKCRTVALPPPKAPEVEEREWIERRTGAKKPVRCSGDLVHLFRGFGGHGRIRRGRIRARQVS